MRGLRARWRHERWRRDQWRRGRPKTRGRRVVGGVGSVARVLMGWPGAWVIGGIVVVLVWIAGAGGSASPRIGPPVPHAAQFTYAAIGGNETLGAGVPVAVRDAYPQVLFRTQLSNRAVHVNLGLADATAGAVERDVLPEVADVRPALVTILLGLSDARAGTDVAAFAASYEHIAEAVQAAGARQVLLATVPPLEGVSAGTLDAYNGVVRDVATRHGFALVEAAQSLDPAPGAAQVDPDTHQLTKLGHAALAQLFGAAVADEFLFTS